MKKNESAVLDFVKMVVTLSPVVVILGAIIQLVQGLGQDKKHK
jgi:hypothetical protein